MTDVQTQYSALYHLWEVYLHMRVWGAPEYEEFDKDAQEQFMSLIRNGALVTYVEDCKRDVLRSGIKAPDNWLSVLCAARMGEANPLPQLDRDRIGAILNEIYPALARLDPDAQPRDDEDHDGAESSSPEMNDAVRRAGASLEWVQRERPDLAPAAISKERYTRDQYEYVRENGGPAYPLDDHNRGTVPVWDTWSRYVREYLRLTEGRVNFPRRGRTGRSLVRPDELVDSRDDD